MNKPILLFINGPVGIGKSTIAQKYVHQHRLAILLSADDFVSSMGQWLKHEDEARDLAFSYVQIIATQHLKAGYDVVMPYLLTNPEEASVIEKMTYEAGANFFECALLAPKEEIITRALERGTWGESGASALSEQDIPRLEHLFDKMLAALHERPNTIRINSKKGDIENTYLKLMRQIDR